MRSLARFLLRWQNPLGLVVAFAAVAAFAPALASADGATDDGTPRPSSELAPFGTLSGQIDLFHTVLWGSHSALRVGPTVTLFTGIMGVTVGLVIGYVGGMDAAARHPDYRRLPGLPFHRQAGYGERL